jgi:tRNA(Ile)-lysidine synthase
LQQKKVLLACSGGVDSMVLCHLLQKANIQVVLAHCNFMLRDTESETDMLFVENYALQNKLPFFVKKIDTNTLQQQTKKSIQVIAREERYRWFYELLKLHKLDYIITAHHADDQAETFLMHFIRGTGIDGLQGIPKQNGKIIRPLLNFSKEQIVEYAHQNQLNWREDSSNQSNKYFRNAIRNKIIPLLKEQNTSFTTSFLQTLEHLSQTKSLAEDAAIFMYQKVVTELQDEIKFDIKKLLKLPNYNAYLYQWLQPFGYTSWQDLSHLVEAQSGKKIYSPSHILLKDRDFLILKEIKAHTIEEQFIISYVEENIKFPLKLNRISQEMQSIPDKYTIFVNENKLQFPLTIRTWQEGDYFYPAGMHGKKKVSKFFKDEKLSVFQKKETWLLVNGNQEIIWIIGMRMDNRFFTNTITKESIQFTYTKH